MRNKNFVVLVAVASMTGGSLTGCVAGSSPGNPKPVELPDGTKGYTLHCAGPQGGTSDCANQATHICGGLYAIVDPRTAQIVADVGSGDRTLTIRCLPP